MCLFLFHGINCTNELNLPKLAPSQSSPPLSQGSFLLSVGSEVDFVSSNQAIAIKLLKVDLDYTINERYRFFVPKIEEKAMCYQNQEVICGSEGIQPDKRVVILNKRCSTAELRLLKYIRLGYHLLFFILY